MSLICTNCGKSTNSTWMKCHVECIDYKKGFAMARNDQVEVLPIGTIIITVANKELNLFGEGAMEAVFKNLVRVAFPGGHNKTPSALFIKLDENGSLIGTREVISHVWEEEIPADSDDSDDEGTPARFAKDLGVRIFGGDAKEAQNDFETSRQLWHLRRDGIVIKSEQFSNWSDACKVLTDWFRELFRDGFLYAQRTKAEGYPSSVERELSVSKEIMDKKRKALDDTIIPKFSKKRISDLRKDVTEFFDAHFLKNTQNN